MREDLEQIKAELNKRYRLGLEIEEYKLVSERFNIYIDIKEMEDKAVRACDYITENYDYFVDYEIISEGYCLVIKIF